jgi:hypothetical protein
MDGRGGFRGWARFAGRAAARWVRRIAPLRRCRSLVYRNPETDARAERIGSVCPECACEMLSVGRHGSPGRVRITETLHSILIGPHDFTAGQIAVTVVTHAEKRGMSILRGAASNQEFETIIAQRTKDRPERWLHKIVSLRFADVRSLVAVEDTAQRQAGDRLYCVLDTDMEGLPHHADLFAAIPRVCEGKKSKDAWRTERGRLMVLMMNGISTPVEFRNGALAAFAPQQPGG